MKLKSFECMEVRGKVCERRPTALVDARWGGGEILENNQFASAFSVSAQAAYWATLAWLSALSVPLART